MSHGHLLQTGSGNLHGQNELEENGSITYKEATLSFVMFFSGCFGESLISASTNIYFAGFSAIWWNIKCLIQVVVTLR